MTFRQLLAEGRARLAAASPRDPLATPDLDARVLLCQAAGFTREKLIVESSSLVSDDVCYSYERLLDQRAQGWPVAYLTGTKEFMGLDFSVGEGVLVPRPDTETLVEAALDDLRRRQVLKPLSGTLRSCQVIDVCSGSGCVGIALAHHAGSTDGQGFWACDISPSALETTRKNAARHGLTAFQTVESDLLDTFPPAPAFDLIVSNPPYLTPEETRHRLESEGWKEPGLALDGGAADGLSLVRRLVAQAWVRLVPGGALMLEAAPSQRASILELMERTGLVQLSVRQDLASLDRVWIGYKPE